MASNKIIVTVVFDFSQLDQLFNDYVADRSLDAGMAREWSDDFLGWLRKLVIDNAKEASLAEDEQTCICKDRSMSKVLGGICLVCGRVVV